MPDRAESGYSGPKVKSDCLVRFERTDTDLFIEAETTGDISVIKDTITSTAARMGVESGIVRITDHGAMPFTIAARFEASVIKVLGDEFNPLPPASAITASAKDRPRRSRLYVPGNRPRFIEKALLSGADGIILDLEDSIAPSRKFEARILVAHALANLDFGDMEVMVRINQGERALDDIAWILPQPVQHILLPKVETGVEVECVRDICQKVMELSGRKTPVWLMSIVESPLGVFNALEIATAVPESCALTLGLQDLSAEMGVVPTIEGTESFTARSLIVLAARAAELQPIDTVYADVKNEEGLMESIRRAKALGFIGKGCIHPMQVPIINDGFLPETVAVEKAMKIVLAMEDAEKRGLGAVALGSKMVDPPVARQSQTLVDNAIKLGVIPENWRAQLDQK